MLNKLLSLIVLIRYGKLPWEVRYFYRDTLYCQVMQWKYWLKDLNIISSVFISSIPNSPGQKYYLPKPTTK
ncbi:hypothetical protein [Dyadobacter psychrophilus]|uniref:Uncharacterized protein n=1 Tax=Dyadobacter psychrophilus TaxID=651661 RepID=A0A1T5DLZ9_9BACT|nr:hypothetical protein [Dyadobacter psychrophilus]SKB72570.1 hypothetical protein SAMN05660293_01725 [Dyadobacter psychrophilus]